MEYVGEILIFILKGIIIGIVASAPMGPVGILCIRRTVKKGRLYGRAAKRDLLYALLTGYGLALISPLTEEGNVFWVKIAGSIMLAAFGVYMYRTGPRVKKHPESGTKGSLLRKFVTSFSFPSATPPSFFFFWRCSICLPLLPARATLWK